MRKVENPPNSFETEHRERLEPPPPVRIQVFEDKTRSILSRNESPDLSFRWSLNPYRGCFHACAYCYARPSHEYWGFGAGTDFESKLMAKQDAAILLRQAFQKPSWQGDVIVFSGNTDCYQPVEATYGLTRRCLEVCAEFRNPVGIITKSGLIVRDRDLLQRLAASAWVQVFFSIPFSDDVVARKVEPQAPSITKRFEAMQILSDAGISTAVSIAPIIPGLNEEAIPEILRRAKQAGATHATYILLRLPGSTEQIFFDRMAAAFPDRIDKIKHRLQQIRGGAMTDERFFRRHQGEGPSWQIIQRLFEAARLKREKQSADQVMSEMVARLPDIHGLLCANPA